MVKFCAVSNSAERGKLTAYIETDIRKYPDVLEKLKGVMEESEFKGLDIDFKIVDKVPLTLTGKIDRKALRVYEETTMKNKSNVEKRIPREYTGMAENFV